MKEKQWVKHLVNILLILSKYIAALNYFDKVLIVLSVTGGETSIASFTTTTGLTIGIATASFSFAFSIITRAMKKENIKNNAKENKEA